MRFLSETFVNRFSDWDEFAAGYLRGDHKRSDWKKKMKQTLKAKDYDRDAFEYYADACEKYRGFIERN